jgi:uncharacterized cupin superfamily protein
LRLGLREPHWHPNAAELIYVLSGEAEIGLVGPLLRHDRRAETIVGAD